MVEDVQPTRRSAGQPDQLLADLIESDVGSDEDRELARRIARIRLGGQLAPGVRAVEEVDLSLPPGDNGTDGQQEEPR